jgi:hypothetical protein
LTLSEYAGPTPRPVLAEEPLGDLVDDLVVGGNDVRVRRNHHVRGVNSARRELLDLGEQHIEVDDDSIADDWNAHRVQNAGWQQVQGVALAVHNDRVASVVAA